MYVQSSAGHECPTCGNWVAVPTTADHARFASKLNKTDTCWLWKGWIQPNGYGRFSFDGRQYNAHRIAYEWYVGSIPRGMFICHRCDVRGCVRPDHLFAGTAQENVEDMYRKGRGLLKRGSYCRGVENTNAKLTPDKVREIRSRYVRGNGTQLALEFSVSKHAIHDIVRGHSWWWVDDRGAMTEVMQPKIKLAPAQVAAVRARWAASELTQAELALEFGVHQTYISRLLSGKRRAIR